MAESIAVKEAQALAPAAEPRAADDRHRFRVKDYAIILKPRVMSLVVFTGAVGLFLAPGSVGALQATLAVACIAAGAGAAGAINMWYDRDIDVVMRRTMHRPLPAGRMRPWQALAVGLVLAFGSVAAMALAVDGLAAALLAATIVYYVFVYTIWLKRRTPQNIVVGGASGALPPVIGWAAAMGSVDAGALALFAIIFLWTPPHSWALALFRSRDYETAGVPMLPVVAGVRATKVYMLVYTTLLLPATFLPIWVGLSGNLYAAAAIVLDALFVGHAIRVWRDETTDAAKPMFLFSILYLFLLFAALLLDRAAATLS